MKRLPRLAAAGLAGCMLLMGTVPEAAVLSTVAAEEGTPAAETQVTAGDLTFTKYDDHAEVIKCAEEAAEVVIPAEVDGLPVTSIGDWAFNDCKSLTAVTIPDSVTSIGDSAFYACTSLTAVTIPDSVTSIGQEAFSYCTALTAVTIPDSVTSIGDSAFYGCESLTAVTIPDSVTSISDSAFWSCTALTAVTIPDSVTSIGGVAFQECTSLTAVTIPDSVTSISDLAFYGCTALTAVTIPDSVTSIGKKAFSGCKSLTDVTIPDSVTSIGYGAFYDCTSLTDVTILNPDCEINDDDYTTISTGNEDTVIKGYDGSTAQAYAEKYHYTFEILGAAPEKPTEPVTEPSEAVTEPAEDPLYTITAPEIPALTVGQEYTFDMTVTRTDGKAIGTISGFRKMGEEDAYYASWEGVTTEESTATIKVTLKAEKAFSGFVNLGIALQIEGVELKDTSEQLIDLTINEAEAALYTITAPEIPALTVGQEYTFDMTVTRTDGKAIGTISGFRKMGEEDAYYASWEGVTTEESTATIKVTLKAEKAFSGFVNLAIALQIEGVELKDTSEQLIDLTINEAAADAKSGDVDGDGVINASDAAKVLIAAAAFGGSGSYGLTDAQIKNADVNGDTVINASDAALILQYSAYVGGGGKDSLDEFLKTKAVQA